MIKRILYDPLGIANCYTEAWRGKKNDHKPPDIPKNTMILNLFFLKMYLLQFKINFQENVMIIVPAEGI